VKPWGIAHGSGWFTANDCALGTHSVDDVVAPLGGSCDILTQDLIEFDRILIPPRYTLFSGSSTKKNSGLSVLNLEQFQDG
jgi:hypothetical protein